MCSQYWHYLRRVLIPLAILRCSVPTCSMLPENIGLATLLHAWWEHRPPGVIWTPAVILDRSGEAMWRWGVCCIPRPGVCPSISNHSPFGLQKVTVIREKTMVSIRVCVQGRRVVLTSFLRLRHTTQRATAILYGRIMNEGNPCNGRRAQE